MRVLVTGGAGFVGSHACKALAEAGHSPIVFDNLRSGHRALVQWGPLEHGDICDLTAISAVMRRHQPEAVMHFAALAYVGESVAHPDLYYRTNVAGTLVVLEAMRAHNIKKIVASSTCATYGCPDQMPISEAATQIPVNPYGRSKLMAEHMMRDACGAFGLGVIALRYFNAAGADPEGAIGEEHDPETHLIPLLLQSALGLRSGIDIFGEDYETCDGTCVRDYVHVADLASAHVSALTRCEAGVFKVYNLGAGRGASVAEVVAAVRAVTGRVVPIRSAARRPGDPAMLIADPSKATEALGWKPLRSELPTMIEDAWAWMTKYRSSAGFRPFPPAF
ncbi:MAG: UDP-glucose 4-epimerase [Hyphomicrobiales bacterium]|nr:UDP-glucose 4-epimerase [Hyphomicrobiales bacterium]